MNRTDTSAEIRQAKARFGIVGNAPSLLEAVQVLCVWLPSTCRY